MTDTSHSPDAGRNGRVAADARPARCWAHFATPRHRVTSPRLAQEATACTCRVCAGNPGGFVWRGRGWRSGGFPRQGAVVRRSAIRRRPPPTRRLRHQMLQLTSSLCWRGCARTVDPAASVREIGARWADAALGHVGADRQPCYPPRRTRQLQHRDTWVRCACS